jgi:HlyD family secretion protein
VSGTITVRPTVTFAELSKEFQMIRIAIVSLTVCVILFLSSCSRQPPQPGPDGQATSVVSSLPTVGLPSLPTVGLPSLDGTPEDGREVPLFTVERGEVVEELTLNGRVALVQFGVSFADSGVVSEVFVAPGDQVAAGDLLAQLASADLESELSQARADYTESNAVLQRAVEAGQFEVRRAELALDAAKLNLAEAERAARPDELSAARASLQQAQANLATVRNNASAEKNAALEEMNTAALALEAANARYNEALARFEGSEKTAEDRATFDAARESLRLAEEQVNKARIVYDTARGNEVAAVTNAEATVMTVQAQLDRLLAGPDPFVVAEAERNVRVAEVGLQEARTRLRPDPGLSGAITLATSQIERLERQLESRRLYAPIDGTVLSVEVARGTTAIAATPVFVLAVGEQREVIAASSPGDNVQLMVGQQVELVFARYPGQRIDGTITRVPGRAGEGDDALLVMRDYAISYDAGSMDLDVGDAVEVHILVGRAEQALWLPPEAIRTSRDQPYVTLRDSSGDRRVDVLTGLTSPTRVEILRGLNEGDTVVGVASVTR